ncbi:hypothetical protein [Sphingomonas sp. ACRSK]|uniref:hypothetical protein n=1 Tax=Sphingomonas sp. ACRSK TaxID=2918213 RepID=UPI001EF53605|nr:hypothetical protein [Sphingomonas sp. ACRSK]MCG7349311.1 hypothetical protein [Sphingomonas sp. ACRSK]
MLSISSYHTAIMQTGAAMFCIAAPVSASAFVPLPAAPAAPMVTHVPLRAVNDNLNATRTEVGVQPFDHVHNEALFNALMCSSTEVSGPIHID